MDDPRDSESPFGVLEFLAWDHDWNDFHYAGDRLERGLSLLKESGVAFVRMDFLWADIEPEPGRFQFEKYDRLVGRLIDQGIRILAILLYNPTWSGHPWNQAPDPLRYTAFARAVVSRYKDRVRHWQIWNEPDHETYWLPQDGMRAYSALLQRVSAAIKELDPSAKVHLGGLSQALPRSLGDLYSLGAAASFDVVDFHPFINPLMPDALGSLRYLFDGVREILKTHRDAAKPLWLTEIGCPGLRKPTDTPDWWLGKNPTEKVQAEWVRTLYTQVVRWPGIERIFWAFLRDTPNHFKTGTDYLGLVRNDFTPKPSFDTYRDLAKAWRR